MMKKGTKAIIAVLIIAVVCLAGFLIFWQFDLFGLFKDYKAVPAITLKGEAVMTIEGGNTYKEPGYSATINGVDETELVKVNSSSLDITKAGKYYITYSLANLKGRNEVVVKRTVNIVDTTPPEIKLKGESSVRIMVGAEYKDAGAVAADKVDGDLSKNIKTENNVNTSQKGKYTVKYSVTDSSGNKASVSRTVIVYKITAGKTVYLTFDDGPSKNTDKILDLLKKYNAHATFFVVGQNINANQAELKRIKDEGSTIGVHTYTHEYQDIYKSTSAFWADNSRTKSLVKDITGYNCTVMRFPGGSSNTISANYCRGVMSALVKQTDAHGYEYFDWNISSGDAEADGVPADSLYKNVMQGIHENYTTPVVLMHDTLAKSTSVTALERILKTATAEGYTFAAIDDTVEPVHHGVNN